LFGSGANSVWNEAWYFGLPDYSSKLSRNVKRVSRPVVPERQSNSYKRDRPAS
jgi:hypothetical protein